MYRNCQKNIVVLPKIILKLYVIIQKSKKHNIIKRVKYNFLIKTLEFNVLKPYKKNR